MNSFQTAGRLALVGVAVALMPACQEATGPIPELTSLPRALSPAEVDVISASNAFSFRLLDRLVDASAGGNVSVSPFSVSMALGMTLNGADGATWSEMRDVLAFDGLSQEQINQSYRGLIDLLTGLDPSVSMTIANSVWHEQNFPVSPTFLDVVRTTFGAEISGLDFGEPSSLKTINDWVKSATSGKIPTIIDQIDPLDVMFLINAIYFDAQWRQRFKLEETRDGVFTTANGGTRPVPMMSVMGEFPYTVTDAYQIVELPYGNGAFAMTLLLPNADREIDEVMAELDEQSWDHALDRMTPGRVAIELPKFRIEGQAQLNETLQALGMNAAFDAYTANFSRMSPFADGLFISDVVHKTYIDVDEEGTEAAAATAVGISVVSMPPTIRINRPFLAVIREKLSGTILFAARITDPTS